MVKFYNNILMIDGKEEIFFTEIADTIDLEEKIIVIVYSTSQYVDYQVKDNIFAINRDADILWQVETPFVKTLGKLIPQRYLGIKLENQKLLITNGMIESEIDKDTGKILGTWESPGRVTHY